jgi:aconitate hydratase
LLSQLRQNHCAWVPDITDWPTIYPLAENLLLVLTAVIKDAVTTTDELIPSGETSSYRSNPQKLAEFALSRRVPSYVRDSKRVQQLELNRLAGNPPEEILAVLRLVTENPDQAISKTAIGSVIFANKPGDGSARERRPPAKSQGGYAIMLANMPRSAIEVIESTGVFQPFTID